MRIIHSKISLFELKHPVIIYDAETKITTDLGAVDNEHLAKYLVSCCKDNGINHLHLYGAPDYMTQIIQNIQEENMKMYKDNYIEIEVN